MIRSNKPLEPLNKSMSATEEVRSTVGNRSTGKSGAARFSPDELKKSILENIRPKYRGWVAAVGFWQSVSSKEMLQRSEEEIHLWDEFRVSMIPLDIPRELDPRIMVAECAKIGIKVDLKNLEIKPGPADTMSEDRVKGLSAFKVSSEKRERGNGRYTASA